METSIQSEERADSIYTGTMPEAAAQSVGENNTSNDINDDSITAAERKKYHSSAMYAASRWHNTVSHVKAHSNKGLDL